MIFARPFIQELGVWYLLLLSFRDTIYRINNEIINSRPVGSNPMTEQLPEQSLKVYEFGPFRMDTTVRRLLRNGRPLSLTSKVFDMLLLLVRKHGQLVTKEELVEELWPDRFVVQNNLTVHMATLRKILGERHRDHKYIETVPGRGY